MKLSYLVKGLLGHPLHPPLTDATIGIYTGAAVFAVLSALGVSEAVPHPEKQAGEGSRAEPPEIGG
jgi:hypothetical protein